MLIGEPGLDGWGICLFQPTLETGDRWLKGAIPVWVRLHTSVLLDWGEFIWVSVGKEFAHQSERNPGLEAGNKKGIRYLRWWKGGEKLSLM